MIHSLMDTCRSKTNMNAYVGVTNDVSLAVKSILQVKKAFRMQMKCVEELTKANKSLKQSNLQLEKKNEVLAKKIFKLEAQNEKQSAAISDFFCGDNGVNLFGDVFDIENNHVAGQEAGHAPLSRVNKDNLGEDVHHKHKGEYLCPTSPVASNKQGCKRKGTPKKKTIPRKSRRLSNREQTNQSTST